MELNQYISKRIKELRDKHNLSTNKLADKSGVTQSFITDTENCKTNISVNKLSKICDAFGITLQDFFNDQQEINININKLIHNAKKLNDEQIKKLNDFIEAMNK